MKQKDLFRNALRQGAGLPTERSSSDILAAGKSRARVRPSLAGYAAVAAASAVIAGSGVLFVMSSRSTAKPELSANDASQALSSSEEIRAERTIDLSALQGLLEDISESPELFDYSASRTRLDIDKGEEEMYYISNESKDEAAAETLRSVATSRKQSLNTSGAARRRKTLTPIGTSIGSLPAPPKRFPSMAPQAAMICGPSHISAKGERSISPSAARTAMWAPTRS